MNADALITLLGGEAAREEALNELDRLLAAHAAGALREDELNKLEARAVEQPEFRRTLDAYAPLGAEVEQRIVGALRGVLGREPSASGRRSSTYESDVMRASNLLLGAHARSGVASAGAFQDCPADDEREPFTDRSASGPRRANAFPVDGEAAFELLMQQSYADGKLAWPTVKLGYESFSSHVRRAVGKAPDWEWQIHAGDLYLCCACALGDRDATRLLDTQILPRAAKAIARIESDASFVDEALQILRHKLFVGPDAKISVYSGRGSLTAWLRVTATRVALDGLRALGAQRAQHVELLDRMAQPSVNPLNDLLKSRYAEAFQEALRSAIRELSVRDRSLLRLRLVGHCGIDQLGQMYRVHRATAARWLKAAHTRVFDSVREQLRARFQLSDDEFDQMALDMQSRLELSLSGLGVDGAVPALDGQAEAELAVDQSVPEHASAASDSPGSASEQSPELEHSRQVTRHEADDLPGNGVSWSRD